MVDILPPRRVRHRAAGSVPAGSGPSPGGAAGELRAAGETAVRRDADPLRALTPQELQISRLLASGRTTRKLGVSSRSELVSRLRD